jgi:hypothetical protein
MELEVLREKWLASISERSILGRAIAPRRSELARRDLAAPTTPQLLSAARNLRHQIEQATGSLQFSVPVNEIPPQEYHEQV